MEFNNLDDFLGKEDLASSAEKRYGIPTGLMAKIRDVGERSGSSAVSPKGNIGLFQISQDVIKKYRVKNPTDPAENTDAAGKLLRDTLAEYRSTYPRASDEDIQRAVVAHYNGGYAAGKAVMAGKQPPAQETRDYVARVSGPKEYADLDQFLAPSSAPANPQAGKAATEYSDLDSFLSQTPAKATQPPVSAEVANLAKRYPAPKPVGPNRALQGVAEEPGWFEPGSKSEAAVQGFSSGSTLGLGPLAAPYIRRANDYLTGGNTSLEDFRNQQVDIRDRAEQLHPGVTLTGSLAGGLAMPMAGAKTVSGLVRGSGLAGKLAGASAGAATAGGIQGTVQGAANKAMEPDASLGDVGHAATVSGATGAVLGGTMPILGSGVVKAGTYLAPKAGNLINKLGETGLGQKYMAPRVDINPVTGQPFQENLLQLLGDKTGLSALTEEGLNRQGRILLGKSYSENLPQVTTKAKNPVTGKVEITTSPRYEYVNPGQKLGIGEAPEIKPVTDNLVRELVGDVGGKPVYGPPETDFAKIPRRARGNEVTDSSGGRVGFQDPSVSGGGVVRDEAGDVMTSGLLGSPRVAAPMRYAQINRAYLEDERAAARKALQAGMVDELTGAVRVPGSPVSAVEAALRHKNVWDELGVAGPKDIEALNAGELNPELAVRLAEGVQGANQEAVRVGTSIQAGKQVKAFATQLGKDALIDTALRGLNAMDLFSGDTTRIVRLALAINHTPKLAGAFYEVAKAVGPDTARLAGAALQSKNPDRIAEVIQAISGKAVPTGRAVSTTKSVASGAGKVARAAPYSEAELVRQEQRREEYRRKQDILLGNGP